MFALALAALMQVPPPDAPAVPAAPDTAAIVPVSQVLELELDPASDSWTGRVRARLTVRREARSFTLRMPGTDPGKLELSNADGPVPLSVRRQDGDTVRIEARAPLSPGAFTLSLSLAGHFASSGPGLRRPDEKHVVLDNAAAQLAPRWPAGTPETSWRLSVRAPAKSDVISSLPRATRSLQKDWGTWEFASATAVSPDSLRAEVRPLVPRPVRRSSGSVRRGTRRR